MSKICLNFQFIYAWFNRFQDPPFPAEQNRKVLDEARVLDILRQTPASRFGSPEDLIGATLLLASHGAGAFITGTEMVVDGGFNAMKI